MENETPHQLKSKETLANERTIREAKQKHRVSLPLLPTAEKIIVEPLKILPEEKKNGIIIADSIKADDKYYRENPYQGIIVAANPLLQDRFPHNVGDLVLFTYIPDSRKLIYKGVQYAAVHYSEITCKVLDDGTEK